jgi:arylsulfatase A
VYAAMLKNLDDNVGRLLAHLKERGLDKNTIVIFTSDNGGFIGADKKKGSDVPVTNNAPLRSGKASLYEGGIRVPLMIRWPGVTPARSECATRVILTDLFHTCMHAAGMKPAADLTDGKDLTLLLKNPDAPLDRNALFFHYPHYYGTTTPVSAMIEDDWKALEYFEDGKIELFNIKEDPSEEKDVSKLEEGRVGAMRKKLHEWRAAVGANMPRPNPNFRPKMGL